MTGVICEISVFSLTRDGPWYEIMPHGIRKSGYPSDRRMKCKDANTFNMPRAAGNPARLACTCELEVHMKNHIARTRTRTPTRIPPSTFARLAARTVLGLTALLVVGSAVWSQDTGAGAGAGA